MVEGHSAIAKMREEHGRLSRENGNLAVEVEALNRKLEDIICSPGQGQLDQERDWFPKQKQKLEES